MRCSGNEIIAPLHREAADASYVLVHSAYCETFRVAPEHSAGSRMKYLHNCFGYIWLNFDRYQVNRDVECISFWDTQFAVVDTKGDIKYIVSYI